jgi:phage tail-like protein
MRTGVVEGLVSPHRLIDGLPGLYHEDELARRLLSAFDDLLAPVFLALDDLAAYLDPALTPDDFLDWLASWVGVLVDENWPIERRRAFVAQAVQLYRQRGTRSGLEAHIRTFTGGDVSVEDTGGVAWSATSGGALPGRPGYAVRVRVSGDGRSIDPRRLDDLVASAKPAHVVHVVEVGGPPAG